MSKIMLLVIFLLAGCTAVPEPTSVIPLAQSTVAVERPSATPLPTLTTTNTVAETAVFTPTALSTTPPPVQTITANPIPFTETPAATPTPNPDATPRPGVSPPILSSLGQLAFVQEEVLYVETAVGSGIFQEVGHYVTIDPVWSPDGEKLVYSISQYPSDAYEWSYPQNQYLWLTSSNTSLSLSGHIPGFLPLADLINVGWSPDNTKIVFEASAPDMAGYNPGTQYFMVNLSEISFMQLIDRVDKGRLSHMTNEVVVVLSHCGAPCQEIIVVNYQGQKLWQPEWRSAGFISYLPDNQFMINIGLEGDRNLLDVTVEKIDLFTGNLNIIWKVPGYVGCCVIVPPPISPDGRFIAFNLDSDEWDKPGMLYVLDLNGRIYHECETCRVLDWQPGGGPVAVQTLLSGEKQLVYLPLDGSLPRIFVTPKLFTFGSGKWSPDGRYFVYSTFDEATSAAYLYLWQPDSGEPTLIHAAASDESFSQFAWMPDSSGFYFNEKGTYTELWRYEVETAEIYQITTTEN